MPSLTFDVESYTVHTMQTGTTATGAWRNLRLTSTALTHGIRNRASIFFFQNPSTTLGVVFNVDQPNFNGLSVYAYCLKPDYDDWYDILRNEQPLKFSCGYGGPDFDPGQPARELSNVELYTGEPEPPGEGPEEVQAKLFPAEVVEMLRGRQQ